MSLTCALLATGQTVDCDNPTVAGAEGTVYFGNLSELTGTTEGVNGQISAMTFAATKGLKKYTMFRKSVRPSNRLRQGTYKNAFEHQLQIVVHIADQDAKAEFENMANSNVYAIVIGRDQQIEVYGIQVGLEVESMERDLSNAENEGAYVIDLKTGEYPEPRLPQTFLDTDYSTSITTLDGYMA